MTTDSYSGLLNITASKSLHYIFTKSENDPANDPVLLWYNGGPGCSSLLGFFQENGPWVINDGGSEIVRNPFPWNRKANVLWLEQPAGVGYSWGENIASLSASDSSSGVDAVAAMKLWYARFPAFTTNKLFLSGESYAGIYVPYLAWQIYQHNEQARYDTTLAKIPLEGILTGNSCADWDFDGDVTTMETVARFNMIPKRLFDEYISKDCEPQFRDVNPVNSTVDPARCDEIENHVWGDLINGLNPYDLYRYQYADGNSAQKMTAEERLKTITVDGQKKTYKRGITDAERMRGRFGSSAKHFASALKQDVKNDFVTDYINN